MSTKTTIKRIALVAVAALGFGVLSVAPSTAAPTAKFGTMYDSTNGVAVVGGQASVIFWLETSSTYTFSWSGVATVLSATTATGTAASGGTGTSAIQSYSAGYSSGTLANSPTSGSLVIVSNTTAGSVVTLLTTASTAGTSTITVNPVLDSTGLPGTPVSKSVTWSAASYTPNVAFSTSYLTAATTGGATADDATINATKTAGTQAGQIEVNLKNDLNAALTYQPLTFAITSGPGLLGSIEADNSNTSTGTNRYVTTATNIGNFSVASMSVWSDGTAGTTVITVSSGTTVLATETLNFVGAAATYTPTVYYSTLQVGSNSAGTSTDKVIRVKAVDSNGNKVVNGSTIYAVSNSPLVASIAASATTTSGYAYFDVAGVSAGTSTFTFRNASTAALSTVTATTAALSVTTSTLSSATSKVAMKFDKASYVPGEKMTLSITYTGAGGVVLADNGATGYAGVFADVATANVALAGTLPGTDAFPTDGVEEFTLYAPLIPGEVVVTTNYLVGVGSLNAQYLAKLTASATVEGGPTATAAQAAADAAAEATDAANAATDAANAAAEAADAATAAAQDAADAVAALSAQVATLISGLKAQLTALTNLVIKIQKKVKA